MSKPKTFVLVHGAWHGGWCWGAVATKLRQRGHTVMTPTQTGLGERKHLISTSITLDTFIEDIANVIQFEQLDDIVLVGHSFGGHAVSGVADRMPERIKQLCYLDAGLLDNGERPFDRLPKDVVENRLKQTESSGGVSIPAPPPSAFGVLDPVLQQELEPRLTPHPLSTYQSPLRLAHPIGNGLPATYIICTDPLYGPMHEARLRVAALGMATAEIATGHDAMVTAPGPLSDLLDSLSG